MGHSFFAQEMPHDTRFQHQPQQTMQPIFPIGLSNKPFLGQSKSSPLRADHAFVVDFDQQNSMDFA